MQWLVLCDWTCPPISRAVSRFRKFPALNEYPAASPSNWTLIRRLFGLGWRHRAGCLAVLSQQMGLVLLGILQLGLTGLGIDFIRQQATGGSASATHWPLGLEPPSDWAPLAVVALIAGVVLLLAAVHAGLRFWGAVTLSNLVQRIVIQLRRDVYDKLQRLSFRFFDANQSGSIINRVAGDVQAVRLFIDGVVLQVLIVALSLGLYIGYMLSLHVPLTIACLASSPLLWLGAVVFSRIVRPEYLRNSRLVDQLILTLSENVQGVQVVKGFGRQREEIAKFESANRAVMDQKKKLFWRLSVFQPTMGFLTQFNMIVLIGFGGYLVVKGQLPLGAGLFVFVNLLHQFANQVGQVTNIANSIQASLTGAERVFEVLDTPLEVTDPPQPKSLGKAVGHVRFENVSFSYRPDTPVLREISFEAKPGQRIAIVGATGAGKSTLLSLLPRFYDATAGCVLIDGMDVRDLRVDELRRSVGLVFQESFLFSNTVAANIAFGRPSASHDQIVKAAGIAAASEFIDQLQHGYNTIIGEYGSNLSGGQRQRLAIARAVLLEPPILILDDALAAVDPETEHEIMAAMESAMQGRTTFIVAHRLSTLRRADLVLVLDQGRIVQAGTHHQLLADGGHYAAAALLQTSSIEAKHEPPTKVESIRPCVKERAA
ncbi:MAG: ABC transporter ATP-binding protein [Pirellulales bacterium]|nr:ABC transporter ATP-binding protein [Pirellulales bacterium]